MRLTSRIIRAFPPPPYLAMSAAGVDIGASSVKAVLFSAAQSGYALDTYHESPLQDGVVVDGDIEQPDALVESLRSLRLKRRVRFAHASLPERKAYLYQTLVPKDAAGDLKTAVEFSLESHVPIPPEEIVFDFDVVRKTETGTIVSVTAYAKRVIEAYRNVFARAGITITSLEIESQALARAVVAKDEAKHTLMVVDFGRRTTRIAIVDHGVVGFTATVDVGGETLTAAVMKHLSVSSKDAETIKNERGFLEGQANRDLYETLMSTVSVLRDEVAQHVNYWNTPNEEHVARQEISRIILVGGNANLKGLSEYLARMLGITTRVGNVWEHAFSLDEYIPAMPYARSLEYATAVGLALRSCHFTL